MQEQKKVAVIMGSDSDWPVVKGACSVLKEFGVPYEARILSAHRTPEAAAAFAKSARANGYGVVLCAAGMAAHLAGAFAANTTLPVVGIPMKGGALDGLDALLATVQMPSGFRWLRSRSTARKNAAYLAVSILAVGDEALAPSSTLSAPIPPPPSPRRTPLFLPRPPRCNANFPARRTCVTPANRVQYKVENAKQSPPGANKTKGEFYHGKRDQSAGPDV